MENIYEIDIKDSTTEAFLDYSAYNLQRRAIPDARDGLRWSQRQLLHAQAESKLDCDHPFKKAQKSVSAATSFSYCHGDTSAYGIFIRMAKPFVYRALLQDVNGNYGTQIDSESHAASRYVELRGSALAKALLKDIDKDTITDWEPTYDMEGEFPKVLPSKGFTNLVNGCQSIGSGMNCSIPPFNLKEVNEALIKLLYNPDIDENEIICLPDFPTGATLINKDEVIESLKKGEGRACRIRSTITYDNKNNELIVSDLPYQTYTNTICTQLSELIESEDNYGIDSFIDFTGKKVDIRIKLKKGVNIEKVIRLLYKKTSLQSFFGINIVLLKDGITPTVFTWRQALQAHLDHEQTVYRRGFEFDLRKIKARIHIIDGLLICMAQINEVIKTIKESESAITASIALQKNFLLDEVQAKAVLDMKLSRLANLEVKKLEDEKKSLEVEGERINNILNSAELMNKEIEKGLRQIAEKFGDARRTKIINLNNDNSDEPIEEKSLQVSLTNKNNLFAIEVSTLYTQNKGGVGQKIKLDKDEFVINSKNILTTDKVLFFTNKGYYFWRAGASFELNTKFSIFNKDNERICAFSPLKEETFILLFTKNGYVKKSKLSNYSITKSIEIKALDLMDNDEIINVIFTNSAPVGILTNNGNFIMIRTDDINAIGRTARGIRAIKLNEGDFVCSARPIYDSAQFIVSITKSGLIKKTQINEFSIQTKNTKGSKLQKLTEADTMADFYPINEEKELLISSASTLIKILISDIPVLSRGAQGTKSIKLNSNNSVIQISAY